MSSELRLKKLRGSGGYVIASLTDEQQSKASIGGPDLFLAPLCRMDTGMISKHLCNMCDKEYEGAPKIHYESLNEEVAPELTLIEKGRYLCNTCGTTIAEYREFRKEKEEQIPAAAAPQLEPEAVVQEQIPAAGAAAVAAAASAAAAPQLEQQTDPRPTEAGEARQASSATVTQSANTISGRAVYNEDAIKVGIAKKIDLDATNSIVLVVTQNDGSDTTIPWPNVRKAGEIILLGGDTALPEEPASTSPVREEPQSQQPGKCDSCAFENKEGSKFCEQCGTRL